MMKMDLARINSTEELILHDPFQTHNRHLRYSLYSTILLTIATSKIAETFSESVTMSKSLHP